MKRVVTLTILAAALATAAGAARRDPLEGRVPGPPQQCIPVDASRGGTVFDRQTIIYQGYGGRIYRVQPVGPCPSLRPMTTLITQVYGGQICRNDRFQTIEPGQTIPSVPCRFGNFIPYTRPKTR